MELTEQEKVYLGNYTQDELGVWWRMFPDGRIMVSEEISDLLNFHKKELFTLIQDREEKALLDFAVYLASLPYFADKEVPIGAYLKDRKDKK
jgi:hypothetical protein